MSHTIQHRMCAALVAALLFATGCAAAQGSDVIVGSNADAKITVADFETSILRIPERDRFGYMMSQKNVNQELENLLQMRTIAEAARRQGVDKDPVIKRKMELYNDRILVEAFAAKLEAESVKEFESLRASYLDRAREKYLVNKQQYQRPAEVKVSHILVTTSGRTPEEAQAKVRSLREKVLAGASFEELAVANSDDASVKNNRGDIGYFTPGQMDPAFEAAAFAMKKPGELSEPVHTRFGYHLIRFEDRKPSHQVPFEDALPELLERLKADFIEQKRSQAWKAIYDPAKVNWNEAAVVGLRKHVDPALLKVPTQ
jgi:peptidyl-prolyl cis-trans isomerase C